MRERERGIPSDILLDLFIKHYVKFIHVNFMHKNTWKHLVTKYYVIDLMFFILFFVPCSLHKEIVSQIVN